MEGRTVKKERNPGDVYVGKILESHLRKWMVENGTKRQDFAKRVGVSPSTVSHWTEGKARISPTHMATVMDVLGISQKDFEPPAISEMLMDAFDRGYKYGVEVGVHKALDAIREKITEGNSNGGNHGAEEGAGC
jgi:DNA-binding transcriptional regulator YdaS (Cro superfamily)